MEFYHKNHRYTVEAFQLDQEAAEALLPLFNKWLAAGATPREIAHVLAGTVHELELTAVFSWND